MNIPLTMVAITTLAAESEEVTPEMALRVQELLEGATRAELTVLITSLASLHNYALTLLEQNSGMSKQLYIQDWAKEVAAHEES